MEEDGEFSKSAQETKQKIKKEKERFFFLATKVFDVLKNYAPMIDEADAHYIAKEALKTLRESANTVLCKSACGGAWKCGYCPLTEVFKDLKQKLIEEKEKETTDEVRQEARKAVQGLQRAVRL